MRKKLSSLFFIVVSMLSSISYAGDKVTWIMPWKPGGNADQLARFMTPLLERQGISSEIVYRKSCSQAMEMIRSGAKDSFLVTTSSTFLPLTDTSPCKYDIELPIDRDLFYSSLLSSDFYVCSAPNKNITAQSLTNQRITLGTVANLKPFVHAFVTHTPNNKIIVVPYEGSAELRRALTAGDLDLWFGSIHYFDLIKGEPKCLGASSKNNIKNMPFIGALTSMGSSYPELHQMFLLLGNAPTAKIDQALRLAMKSQEFKDYVANLGATHTGLGARADSKADIQSLIDLKNILSRQPDK